MIRVICNQETFVYNAYHMVKAFYPSETVTSSVDEKASNYVTVEFAEDGTDGQKEAMIEIADRQTNDMPAEKSAMKNISTGCYTKSCQSKVAELLHGES